MYLPTILILLLTGLIGLSAEENFSCATPAECYQQSLQALSTATAAYQQTVTEYKELSARVDEVKASSLKYNTISVVINSDPNSSSDLKAGLYPNANVYDLTFGIPTSSVIVGAWFTPSDEVPNQHFFHNISLKPYSTVSNAVQLSLLQPKDINGNGVLRIEVHILYL